MTSARRRRPPWAIAILLAAGLTVSYGGFATWRDGHSGTPGVARVTGCEGGSGRYEGGIRCRGAWVAGGELVGGDGTVAVGPVQGAGEDDIGKKIRVRIHGTDHATVPGVGTPIALWVLGGGTTLLALLLGAGDVRRRRASPSHA